MCVKIKTVNADRNSLKQFFFFFFIQIRSVWVMKPMSGIFTCYQIFVDFLLKNPNIHLLVKSTRKLTSVFCFCLCA